jgi:hypothetical protein
VGDEALLVTSGAPADPLVAQVDPDLNLVKGRGGALLREKVRHAAEASSRRLALT